MGRHLKKGATGRFAKAIFFPERRYLFESKNYNIWAQMRFDQQKFINLLLDELI